MGPFDAVDFSLWEKPHREQPHDQDLTCPANHHMSELRNKFTSPRKMALLVKSSHDLIRKKPDAVAHVYNSDILSLLRNDT